METIVVLIFVSVIAYVGGMYFFIQDHKKIHNVNINVRTRMLYSHHPIIKCFFMLV